ncbi:unnamed protein product [Linum trigynum]|uniref:Uncharacterized protein n=1 Tax=Linum trigynum TaxID=586398 RepID=A0AAV2CXE2_9ROSI
MEEEKNKKEKEFQARVENEVKGEVEAKEEVLIDGLTLVTCEEDAQALISSQEESKLEIEELQEAEEVKEDILVDVPDLSAPEVEQYNEEQEFHGEDEATKVMEHLPIVPTYVHVDFFIRDTNFEEEAHLEHRQEIQRCVESFHHNGVSTIRGRVIFKKGGGGNNTILTTKTILLEDQEGWW